MDEMKRTPTTSQHNKRQTKKKRPSPSSPLLVRDLHDCSYEELLWLIANLPVCRGGESSLSLQPHQTSGQENNKKESSLPLVLIEEIASYHTILPIVDQEVTVVGASSHDGAHSLQACLDHGNSHSWWLSSSRANRPKPDSIHFRLNSTTEHKQNKHPKQKPTLGVPRRLRKFRIEIPPLPMGPCSVREIQLQVLEFGSSLGVDGVWRTLPDTFVVNNQRGMQTFELPGLDVYEVKVICCSNQMKHFLPPIMPNTYHAVGFSSIQFL